MSEKLFALLLRLYPARFRARYGEESLQLLRDRLRDESGPLARLRLAFDLLTDTALALPRAHRMPPPTITPVAAAPLDSLPSFSVLEEQRLRPAALMFAGVLSAGGLVAFFLLLTIAGTRLPLHRAQAQQARNRSSAAAASNAVSSPATGVSIGGESTAPPNTAASNPAVRSNADNGVVSAAPLDPAERHRVATAIAADLEQFYFDHASGQQAADAVRRQEEHGAYNAAFDGAEFAILLTRQVRNVTGDLHLIVEYSSATLPSPPAASAQLTPAQRAMFLAAHCGIDQAVLLHGSLGYLKLSAFPPADVCGSQMRSALASINDAAAVIVDLRDNRGGDPGMVALVASYLFSRPQPWYNPRDPQPSMLPAPVPGGHLADKPIYILTSVLTISGAEQFSYNLKMLHRATLIGETTAGSAHAGVFHRVDDHYGVGIPEFRIVNPYASRDWEVVGVAPDIKVKAADALAAAEKLAAGNGRAASAK